MPPKKKKKHKKKRVVGVPRVNVVQNNVMSTNGKPLEVVVKNNRTTWGELSVKEREDVEKKRGITRYNPGGSGVGIGVNMSGSSRLKDLENAMDDYGPTQYRAEIKGLREEMDDQMGRHEEQVATIAELQSKSSAKFLDKDHENAELANRVGDEEERAEVAEAHLAGLREALAVETETPLPQPAKTQVGQPSGPPASV